MTITSLPAAIYSSFGNDPDLGDLVEEFVQEIPNRIAVLRSAFEDRDADTLRRTAHQLKGAAGSYGFDQLTPYSAALELSVIESRPEDEIQRALQALIDICGCMRAGVPG
jgi:HPt (histidine-containing phosphotransfer) domain-containing protein